MAVNRKFRTFEVNRLFIMCLSALLLQARNQSGFLDLCSILLKSSHHEAGLSRKRFYGSDV